MGSVGSLLVADDGAASEIERRGSLFLCPAHPFAPRPKVGGQHRPGRSIGSAVGLSTFGLAILAGFWLIRGHHRL